MNQIGKVFPFDHAVLFQSCDGVIAELERPPLDSGKPHGG
jgi:hypothetical protein